MLGADADGIAGRDVVSIGEPGVGEGVVGIGGDRLLEEVDTFFQAVGGASVPGLAAFEIQAIGLGIGGSGLGHALLIVSGELDLQLAGNIAGDVSLNLGDVGQSRDRSERPRVRCHRRC